MRRTVSSEVWTRTGLTTFYILFFIHIGTRRVVVGGITQHPKEEWVNQVARNVTGFDDELDGARYLIRDRDCKFAESFDTILEAVDITPVRLPARSPNLNGYVACCTSFVRLDTTSGNRRRSDIFRPRLLTGAA